MQNIYDDIIKTAIDKAGGRAALARTLKVTPMVIYCWEKYVFFPKSKKNINTLSGFADVSEKVLLAAIYYKKSETYAAKSNELLEE